jgi:hypothetical protein
MDSFRFAERRNLVSARVLSHFKSSYLYFFSGARIRTKETYHALNVLQIFLTSIGRYLNDITTEPFDYSGRTAPLTSKRCILYIYSTNIGTEYFKHGIYTLRFFSSKCSLFYNCNVFGSCIIHILYTECAKIKKIIPAPKGTCEDLSVAFYIFIQQI